MKSSGHCIIPFFFFAILLVSSPLQGFESRNQKLMAKSVEGSWQITNVKGQKLEAKGNLCFLNFDCLKKQMNGFAGCNYIHGKFNFKAKKRQLEFQPLASSRMACPEMQTESEILNSLSEIKTFSIQSGIDPEHPVLKLNTSNGQEVMTLVKMMPIDGKWTVVKINDSLVEGGENEIFLFFNSAQKQVHGKIGCNNYNASLEFSPKKPALVKIGPGITTMMACPDLDLEQSLLKALSEVVSFKKFSDRKAILSNAGGEILIELAR